MTDTNSFSVLLKKYAHPRYWPTWFGLAVLRLMSMLPLPLLAVTGYGVGLLIYALFGSRRKISYLNIRTCFPDRSESDCKKINRHHFCYLGQSVMTVAMMWWISPARFNRLVTIHGREHYDKALEDGDNIILLTPHFLSLEMSGLALQRERPMVGMYQYMKNPLMNEMALRGRSRFCDSGVMFERKSPLRSLLRLINKGLPLFYSPDQDAMRKGVFVPFFGTLASTTPALSKFVMVTKAKVIPCRNHMRPWGQGYDVYLGETLDGVNTSDEIQSTTVMNQSIEKMVEEDPAQYLWVHKRFKTRPEGEPKFYT